MNIYLHDNFLNICVHMEGFSYMAFHRLEWDLHKFFWKIRPRSAFRLNRIHMDKFSVIRVFSDNFHIALGDIAVGRYEIHNSRFFHRFLHKSKRFPYNQ